MMVKTEARMRITLLHQTSPQERAREMRVSERFRRRTKSWGIRMSVIASIRALRYFALTAMHLGWPRHHAFLPSSSKSLTRSTLLWCSRAALPLPYCLQTPTRYWSSRDLGYCILPWVTSSPRYRALCPLNAPPRLQVPRLGSRLHTRGRLAKSLTPVVDLVPSTSRSRTPAIASQSVSCEPIRSRRVSRRRVLRTSEKMKRPALMVRPASPLHQKLVG